MTDEAIEQIRENKQVFIDILCLYYPTCFKSNDHEPDFEHNYVSINDVNYYFKLLTSMKKQGCCFELKYDNLFVYVPKNKIINYSIILYLMTEMKRMINSVSLMPDISSYVIYCFIMNSSIFKKPLLTIGYNIMKEK